MLYNNLYRPLFLLYLWLTLINTGIADIKNEYGFVDSSLVHISITNFNTTESVRCQFVLAHFVTYDLPLLLSGDTLVIPIALEQHNSTLLLVHSDKQMAIENLLCGLDSDWSDTRLDLSLASLQTSTTAHLDFSCGIELQFSCLSEDV